MEQRDLITPLHFFSIASVSETFILAITYMIVKNFTVVSDTKACVKKRSMELTTLLFLISL